MQEKVSASMISFPVQIAQRREAHILKLNPPDKPRLIENEAFFMVMARACGLEVARTRIVRDRENNPGLLVTRFDRSWMKEEKRLVRLHQEDACQFLNRYPADKYRISCREIAEGLSVCAAPIAERARFIRLIAFSYLIANGDLHAKNVSVAALGPGRSLKLSPAYDLLSSLPYGDRRMALKVEGRDDNLAGRYFLPFGERVGVKAAAVRKILEDLHARSEPWLERVPEIGLDERRTADLMRVMRKRREELVEFE
ncbi:MAG: HipA domain-containing protein [Myxococcaceae bacterium]